MKILFAVCDAIGLDTICKKGVISENQKPISIYCEDGYSISFDITKCEMVKINGLGSMIQLETTTGRIFVTVPRIYFNIGSGFVIVNAIETARLCGKLQELLK